MTANLEVGSYMKGKLFIEEQDELKKGVEPHSPLGVLLIPDQGPFPNKKMEVIYSVVVMQKKIYFMEFETIKYK